MRHTGVCCLPLDSYACQPSKYDCRSCSHEIDMVERQCEEIDDIQQHVDLIYFITDLTTVQVNEVLPATFKTQYNGWHFYSTLPSFSQRT